MSATAMITGELAPTRTYHRRRFVYLPHDHPTADGRVGSLVVVLVAARRRAGAGGEVASYGVQVVDDPKLPAGVRRFHLVKDVRPDEEPVFHEVTCGVAEATGEVVEGCDCKAAVCRAPCCRHVDALNALLAEEVL